MDNIQRRERLREELADLTALNGISGHEQHVVEYLREAMQPVADRVEIDAIGNLYATRSGGDGPHLIVVAHSDEIGAIVAGIEPDGFVRFEPVGGTSETFLVGRKVRVRDHLGVVGARPGHLQTPQEARTVPPAREMYIDLGMDSAEAIAHLGIRVGDQITWESELQPTANPERVVGKGIDNRIGCLLVLELLRSLRDQTAEGTVTFVVAVQEEVGLKGARIAAERLRPDAALVVDTTPCPDTPDSRQARTFPVRLGAGPVIQVASGERARGFLLPESVRNFVTRVAEEAGIPYQLGAFAFGNTDASAIYSAAGGIPTIPITIPRRYSHSPVEMLDLGDAVATFDLCLAIIARLAEFPRGIALS